MEELPARVYSCSITNVCSQVGAQVNFELNRRRLENLHGSKSDVKKISSSVMSITTMFSELSFSMSNAISELRMKRLLEASNEAALASGKTVPSQTRQLQRMMESKLGADQDWDTIEKVN